MDKPGNTSLSSDLPENRGAVNPSASALPGVNRPSIHGMRPVTAGLGAPGARPSGSLSQSVSRAPLRTPSARPSGVYGQSVRNSASFNAVPPRSSSPSMNTRSPSSPLSSERNLVTPRAPSSETSAENKSSAGKLPSLSSARVSGQNPALPPKTPGIESVVDSAQGNAETVMLTSDGFDENGNPLPPGGDSEDVTADPEIDAGPAASLPVGMIIDGRYEIKDVLGVGGFATVYRAHHTSLDTDVALKVMDTKKGVDASYSERFFREAKIAAKIRHNNVVGVFDYGHVPETMQPYIAMEMLHGRDLSHEISEVGPLSPKRAFILFRPVLDALSVGHKLGIVHKDLKPENLYLVDPGGQHETMKILDFGVARVNSSEVAKLTTAGQLLGTPRYLAPEYIKSQQVSPAIDVYQMALIISEALTGIPAVTGDPFHAMMLHCSGKLQISEFLLEGRLGEVFRKAIAINPEDRYPDCETFARALDTVADLFNSNVPLKGGAPQIIPDAGMSANFSGIVDGDAVANAQKSKKGIIFFIVVFVLILGVGGGIFYKLNRKAVIEQEKAAAAKLAQEKANDDPAFEFNFDSSPDNAAVRLKGGSLVLCNTPCKYTFKHSELPASITLSADGFETSELVLNELLHKNQSGHVSVDLEKVTVAPVRLPFNLKYSPTNATILENGEPVPGCSLSPCAYVFEGEKKAVTLTISAPGYRSQNIILTEQVHKENSNITINLEKIPANTSPRRETKKEEEKAGAPAPQPAQPAKPKVKPVLLDD